MDSLDALQSVRCGAALGAPPHRRQGSEANARREALRPVRAAVRPETDNLHHRPRRRLACASYLLGGQIFAFWESAAVSCRCRRRRQQ
jgi:hypothetical protein